MTRRNTPIHVIVNPPRAAPPARTPLSRPPPQPSGLPPPGVLMEPEAIVDAARGHGQARDLPIGMMLDASPEALDELEFVASFEDERDMRRSRSHGERLEMALEGALAMLDE